MEREQQIPLFEMSPVVKKEISSAADEVRDFLRTAKESLINQRLDLFQREEGMMIHAEMLRLKYIEHHDIAWIAKKQGYSEARGYHRHLIALEYFHKWLPPRGYQQD